MARSRTASTPTPDRKPRPDPVGLALARVHKLPSVRLLEDRRLFHPERALRPALSFYRGASRLVVSLPKSSAVRPARNDIPHNVGFAVPRKVAVCIRRKERREVLLALGRGGGRVSRKRRRNAFSDVSCK